MGRFTKVLVGGAAAAALAAGSASADFLLADFDDGTNVSNIGTYFYLYSNCSPDSRGDCKSDDVHYLTDGEGAQFAGPADEYGPVSYKPGPAGPSGAGHCAVLHVDKLPAHVEEDSKNNIKGYYPGFGFGILLTDSDDVGYGAEFDKVTAVKFKAKTTVDNLTAGFKVETVKNSFDAPAPYKENPSNAYFADFKPTQEWKEYTIKIEPSKAVPAEGEKITTATAPGSAGDMAQEGWWGYSFTFKRSEATKVAWFIQANKNEGLAGNVAELSIDDVTLVGSFTYTAPDLCTGCTSTSFNIPTPSKKLSDFEDSDPLLNSRNYYWYYYTDKEGGGSSSVSGLVENPHTGDYIMNTAGKGRQGGAGAYIEFTMGTSYKNDNDVSVEPFVGIGANVYDDDATTDFLDASAFTGVYFEYATSANVTYFDLEITDELDAVNKAADKDGEVYYTRIEGSGGPATWKSAKVPFTQLVLPTWVKTSGKRRQDGAPLNLKKLAQVKFKHRGLANAGGELAIDNVYFYGASEWTGGGDPPDPNSVKLVGSKAKVSGIRATYGRGVVGVNWSAAKSVASGTVQLVNTKGRVMASAPITAVGSKVTANLNAGTIPTGMYFVRVNAKDVTGAKVVQQAALSIVK